MRLIACPYTPPPPHMQYVPQYIPSASVNIAYQGVETVLNTRGYIEVYKVQVVLFKCRFFRLILGLGSELMQALRRVWGTEGHPEALPTVLQIWGLEFIQDALLTVDPLKRIFQIPIVLHLHALPDSFKHQQDMRRLLRTLSPRPQLKCWAACVFGGAEPICRNFAIFWKFMGCEKHCRVTVYSSHNMRSNYSHPT